MHAAKWRVRQSWRQALSSVMRTFPPQLPEASARAIIRDGGFSASDTELSDPIGSLRQCVTALQKTATDVRALHQLKRCFHLCAASGHLTIASDVFSVAIDGLEAPLLNEASQERRAPLWRLRLEVASCLAELGELALKAAEQQARKRDTWLVEVVVVVEMGMSC